MGQRREGDVRCERVGTNDRVFADPRIQTRGMQLEQPHARVGRVPSVASPMRLSATPVRYRKGPPTLGEHTYEVLKRVLGADDEALRALSEQHVIKDDKP